MALLYSNGRQLQYDCHLLIRLYMAVLYIFDGQTDAVVHR